MQRDKLIERLRKLLAMSRDSGSPAEAAIASRRLDTLMQQYDVSLAEITRSARQPAQTETNAKRARSTVRRKRRQPKTAPPNRKIRAASISAFIVALGLSSYFIYTKVNENSLSHTVTFEPNLPGSSGLQTPTLTAKVDRTTIIEGGTFVLNITGAAVSSVPNTSVLFSDFHIIQSQVNRSSQGFQMRVELQPRQSGMLFIPSFNADDVSSDSVMINVLSRN